MVPLDRGITDNRPRRQNSFFVFHCQYFNECLLETRNVFVGQSDSWICDASGVVCLRRTNLYQVRPKKDRDSKMERVHSLS
jgi:hypothetical protein